MVRHVAPYVPGCPDAVILDHVIKAARVFCSATSIWNYETEPVYTAPGQVLYDLDMDSDQELVRILSAFFGSSTIEFVNTFEGRDSARQQSGGSYVWIEGDELGIHPTPSVGGTGIVLGLVVKPSLAAIEWPDQFATYVDDLAHGAIATLCLMPKVEWHDPQTASVQAQMFQSRISVTGHKVTRGFGTRRYPGNRLL